MSEKNPLKLQGLAFGRSLQTALKTAAMYSVDHPAAERPLQQSYACLNELLKQTQQFTFGFIGHRVLLNKLLVDDSSLGQLEAELAKRGIAAVSFQAGITPRDFKRALAVLAIRPRVIEEKGGIKQFLEQDHIEGARILPARPRKKETEDIDLEIDPESYRLAQEILGVPTNSLSSLDLLLQSAGLKRPEGFTGNAHEMLELAGKATQVALTQSEVDPRSLLADLVRILDSLTPEGVLSVLSSSKQVELRDRSVEEIASDVLEDIAVQWAAKHLSDPSPGQSPIAAEGEVLQVLLRGLRATRVAERLLQKLSKILAEANVPAEVYERIREGLVWFGLPQKEKHARLMDLRWFSEVEFRHLLDYLKEALSEGRADQAIQVATRYFAFLDSADPERQREGLARAPDLFHVMAGPESREFFRNIVGRLCEKLLDEEQLDVQSHQELASCLHRTAQIAAGHEDFELIHRIGSGVQHSWARDRTLHAECCGQALQNLLVPEVTERLIALSIERFNDAGWTKIATSLLRWQGPTGGEKVFECLEQETVAVNRMRLMRLLARLGPSAIEPARKRLADGRWYVIRNACQVLGELGDPELPHHLSSALRHSDIRVQHAALSAIAKSQAPDRARVLAKSLAYLHASVLEAALHELAFLKDSASIDGLMELFLAKQGTKTAVLEEAIEVLSILSCEHAAEALGTILFDPGQAPSVRQSALEALMRSPCALAQEMLDAFARLAPDDPLAAEWQGASASKASPSKSR